MTATTTNPAEPALSDQAPPRRGGRSALLSWLLPGLVMLGAGATRLTGPALGADERISWAVATRTPGQILALAERSDAVSTPYYLLLHFWIEVFGDSLLALRMPSLIAVALGAAIAGALGRQLFTTGTGLFAGLFVAAVPAVNRFAQEARPAGLAFLLTALATLLLFAALRHPSVWRWLLYAATVALVGYAHVVGLLMLAGHLMAVALHWRAERDARALAGWPVAAAAGLVPVFPLLRSGFPQDNIPDLTAQQLYAAPGAVFGSAATGLLIIGLAFAARGRTYGLAAIAAAGPVALLAISLLAEPLWLPQHALYAVVPLSVLAAAALRGMRWRALAALALAVLVGWGAQQQIREATAHDGMDLRRAAGIIRSAAKPGDGIVYSRSGTAALRAGVDYELRDDKSRPGDALLVTPAAKLDGLDARECPAAECLDTERVWFVGTPDALRDLLSRDYRLLGDWPQENGAVALYEKI